MPVYWLMFLANLFVHMADVVAISFLWQMLLPLMYLNVADVIAIIMCCYDCVADVIATMAGGIAI